ncbi:HNH endonuclease [Ensifer sp. Root558]|uniref:HNH endonuclease n=1 Tax=Ensifer sp. Root558 TaxID=1736558 RepID=UPI00071546FD|nr:HNH endonuclease [Ensifer sp. Root558]KQZ41804.1 hypothetical protein ASD63_16525 [Ensifer sp. Root558]
MLSLPEWIGKQVPPLTQARLLEALHYDRLSGVFTWKARHDLPSSWNTKWAGKEAGCIDGHGYRLIAVDGVLYKAHRLAWLYVTGGWPDADLDHANRNRSDNRFANLRPCSRGENMQNQSVRSNNTSGLPGVSFCKQTSRWRAKIRVDGQQIHLGRFDDASEAYAAYLTAKSVHHTFNPSSPVRLSHV